MSVARSSLALLRNNSKLLTNYVYKINLAPSQIQSIRYENTISVNDSYLQKFMNSVGWMDQSKTRLKLSGYFLYECIPVSVNYMEWFDKCHLPDTFVSWFKVTEVHVWLLMVRCMAEDTHRDKFTKGDGYFIRNCMIEALWADVANRVKLLEGANAAIVKKQISELSEQFQAALVGYDEGLDDDKVLAAAVWRRIYAMSHDADAENVARIVKFIRHQLHNLDNLPSVQFKKTAKIQWLSIDSK